MFQSSNKGGYDGFISKIATSAVVLTPRSVNFGNQSVGTTSKPKNVKLTNIGSTTLAIIGMISITGANAGDFAETNTCRSSVAPGKSCIISVTFTPTATGTRKAAVTVRDSDVTGFQQVSLTGTGT